MRRALLILLFVFAIPAHAHHTKEHVLGAPSPPATATATVAPKAPDDNGRGLWLALGPFFALAALGALRWGYRRRREGKNKKPRD